MGCVRLLDQIRQAVKSVSPAERVVQAIRRQIAPEPVILAPCGQRHVRFLRALRKQPNVTVSHIVVVCR